MEIDEDRFLVIYIKYSFLVFFATAYSEDDSADFFSPLIACFKFFCTLASFALSTFEVLCICAKTTNACSINMAGAAGGEFVDDGSFENISAREFSVSELLSAFKKAGGRRKVP